MKHYAKYVIGVAILAGGIVLLSWRNKVIKTAIDYIDVQEIGKNQGWTNKTFQSMMQSVGWKGGEAWCMYFAKAVYLQAFPGREDKINKVLNGSTQLSWANAAKEDSIFKQITEGNAKPGDIAIWQSVNNPALGHAALVKKKIKGDYWETIEGNSSFEGSRDGQGVVDGDRTLIIGHVDGSLKLIGFLRMKLF